MRIDRIGKSEKENEPGRKKSGKRERKKREGKIFTVLLMRKNK